MANLPHLILPRTRFESPRRKRPGFGRIPSRSFKVHGGKLKEQVDDLMGTQQEAMRAEFDPALVLRVHLESHSNIDEGIWERCGLSLLSVDQDKTFILFSSDVELTEFRSRLKKYQKGPGKEGDNAPYHGIFSSIEKINSDQPRG